MCKMIRIPSFEEYVASQEITMGDKWGDNYCDIVLQEWNRDSSKIEVDRNLPTPDYTKL